MRVTIRGSCSHWVDVISGMPQGSVFRPLRSLIYVNNLPGWIKTNIKMFADDDTNWNMLRHELDSQEMQEDLDRLKDWSNKWLLDFNIERCKVMHVGHKLAKQPFRFCINPIYTVSHKKGSIKLFITLSNLNRFSKFLHC